MAMVVFLVLVLMFFLWLSKIRLWCWFKDWFSDCIILVIMELKSVMFFGVSVDSGYGGGDADVVPSTLLALCW